MGRTRREFVIGASLTTVLLAGCSTSGRSSTDSTSERSTNGPASETAASTETRSASNTPTETRSSQIRSPRMARTTTHEPSKTVTFGPRGGSIAFSRMRGTSATENRELTPVNKIKTVDVLWETLKEASISGGSHAQVSPEQMRTIEATLKANRAFYYVKYEGEVFELEILHDG